MKEILLNMLSILKDTKNYKTIAWVFIIAILLLIVLYPIIDANFLYYKRVSNRIEILDKINNIFIKETSSRNNVIKFISSSWMFIIVGLILPFTKDKSKGKRTWNNILGGLLCLGIAWLFGFIGYKIPTIINIVVNIILYQIIMIYLAYTIATSGNKIVK